MARTGKPSDMWYLAANYLAKIHNVTSDETLGWKTPFSHRHGHTPDISAHLQYVFNQKIFYKSDDTYPSSKELPGFYAGVAKNVGDALTYTIVTESGRIPLERSTIRPATDPRFPNKHVTFSPADDPDAQPPLPSVANYTPELQLANTPLPIVPSLDPAQRAQPDLVRTKAVANALPNRPALAPEDSPVDPQLKPSLVTPLLVEGEIPNKKKQRPIWDPDAPKPSLRDPPPEIRRSKRNRKVPERLTMMVNKAGVTTRVLCNLLMLLSTMALTRTHFTEAYTPKTPNPSEVQGSRPSYCLDGLNRIQQEQLEYVQECDRINDALTADVNDIEWTPVRISDHRTYKDAKGQYVKKVKVQWMVNGYSWVDMDAM